MSVVSGLAVVVAAAALYVSRGVLDQVLTADGLVRIALFPPWQALGGFLAIGALGLLWLDRRAIPRGSTAPRPPLAPLVLPLFGLALLIVPYLPFVADWLPALQVLAGPARGVIWLVIATQLLWTLWHARILRPTRRRPRGVSVRTLAILIGAATAVTVGTVALRFTGTVLYPGGDEPHYLVIAQSLWRDGDLKIENNHTRGDYREYFPRDLDPHYLTRGADAEIYSIHPIGMPVLMAPVYAAGGYPAVVFAFVLMAAAAAAVMWRTMTRALGAGPATFAWAAIVGTSPFLFNAFAIYPEIPAALVVTLAFALLTSSRLMRAARWLAVGVLCGVLPWLSTKYAPMSAALVAVALGRLVFPATSSASSVGVTRPDDASPSTHNPTFAAAAVMVPYALSLLGWFYFFFLIWGSPMPQAPYGALVQTDLRYLVFGAPGLLVDQEYGILPYAPVYVLALTGLWAMWRADAASRRRAIEIVVIFAALMGTVGAFRIWWGGSAPPGRPLTSGLLLLAFPIAAAFRGAAAGSARRAAQHLLLWASIGIAGVLVLAQQGLLTANGRDGTSSLLEYLSPRWPLWSIVPSFIYHEAPFALLHTAAWAVLTAAAAYVLVRLRPRTAGGASLTAILVTSAALLFATIVMPVLPLRPAWPGLDVRARARLPLLDAFDTTARPVAIEYAPLQFAAPSAVVAHAAVEIVPGLRTDNQPIRVLHNGRFSLPAGRYRIEIEWSGARAQEALGLQIGRTGDAWRSWQVQPRPGARWSAEFAIPMDAGFVGLRGSADLERVVGHVRIVPVEIIDVTRRLRVPALIGASRSGPASVFHYDGYSAPEADGFWVLGGGRTRVTIQRDAADRPLALRVHSGAIANRLHVAGPKGAQTIVLQPAQPERVEIPASDAVVTLELWTDSAFVPRAIDPASTDARSLGAWVEVVP